MLRSRNLVQTQQSVEEFNTSVKQINDQLRGQIAVLGRQDNTLNTQLDSILELNYSLYLQYMILDKQTTVLKALSNKYKELK